MKNIALLLFLIALDLSGSAQPGKRIASVDLPDKVVFASVDRPGDLYVLLKDGHILKYDKNGSQIGKIKFDEPPTLFDARDGTLSFAYFRSIQTLEYLTPDLSSSDSRPLHPELAVSALLTCPSRNELWILDGADLSLKKTKEQVGAVAYEVNWPGTKPDNKDVVFMREYQNFLFILDKRMGIHILNNLGKEIKKIAQVDLPYFNFIGEELYYPTASGIRLVDLYTAETRDIPLPSQAKFTLLTDERMIIVTDEKVEFFEFKP